MPANCHILAVPLVDAIFLLRTMGHRASDRCVIPCKYFMHKTKCVCDVMSVGGPGLESDLKGLQRRSW